MQILIINEFGNHVTKSLPSVPRIGDRVDVFYEPLPQVTQVVWCPSKTRMEALNLQSHVDIIITVR